MGLPAALGCLMAACGARAGGKAQDSVIIEPDSAARLMPIVLKQVNGKLDMSTFSYVRGGADGHEEASVRTERVSEPDGAQHWQDFDCGTSPNSPHDWRCVTLDHRTVHVDWDDYRRWIEISIAKDMSGTLARQVVTGLLSELSHTKAVPACDARRPPIDGRELVDKILSSIRLALDQLAEGYSLHDIDFDFDPARTPSVRLKCVHIGEEIE